MCSPEQKPEMTVALMLLTDFSCRPQCEYACRYAELWAAGYNATLIHRNIPSSSTTTEGQEGWVRVNRERGGNVAWRAGNAVCCSRFRVATGGTRLCA